MNSRLRSGIARATKLAAAGEDAATAITALVEPLIAAIDRHPENTIAFQREVLFGAPERGDRYRDVAETETAVADILTATLPTSTLNEPMTLARIIYATIYLDLVRAAQPVAGSLAPAVTRDTVARHVRIVLGAP